MCVQDVADAEEGHGVSAPVHGLAGTAHQGHAALPHHQRQPDLRPHLSLLASATLSLSSNRYIHLF